MLIRTHASSLRPCESGLQTITNFLDDVDTGCLLASSYLAIYSVSELLRIAPMLHKMNRTGVTVEIERGSLVFKTSAKNFVDSIPLEERTLAGRNLWLGKPLYAKTLYIDVDLAGWLMKLGSRLLRLRSKR